MELHRPLSLGDALVIAATHNATILAARKEVEARYGIAIQVRSIVLPKVIESAAYVYQQDTLIESNRIENRELPSFRINIPSLGIDTTVGGGLAPQVNNQALTNDVRIIQSIYEGGRLLSALRQEKLIREQALVDYQTVLADVLLQVRNAYDDAQLGALEIRLRDQSVGLLGGILDKITEQRKVGVVTEFEELRAKVEQDNARTPFFQARQDFIIAKQRLIQLLGYDIPPEIVNNVPIELTTPLRAVRYDQDLAAAQTLAEMQRSELASIHLAGKLADEAIVVAKAGNKPSVQAFAGYDTASRTASRDLSDPVKGGLVGAQLTWPIFDGFLTRGRVMEAVARRGQIAHNTDELTRQIRLQVRSAWARMVEARNILNIQGTNIQSAIRAEDLANTRFFTGIGTQVETLSAQTALTDARDFYAVALRNYSVAYSELLRATGEDMTLASSPKH